MRKVIQKYSKGSQMKIKSTQHTHIIHNLRIFNVINMTYLESYLYWFFLASAPVANYRNQTILVWLEDNLFEGFGVARNIIRNATEPSAEKWQGIREERSSPDPTRAHHPDTTAHEHSLLAHKAHDCTAQWMDKILIFASLPHDPKCFRAISNWPSLWSFWYFSCPSTCEFYNGRQISHRILPI